MDKIIEIIKQLQSTSSRIEKEAILESNKNDILFKKILQFVYNPYFKTGLSTKKIKKESKGNIVASIGTIEEAIEFLKVNYTGTDEAIKTIQMYLNKLDEEAREIVEKILTQELKLGITSKTLNKVFGKGFIKEFNIMLADSYFKNKNDEKLNGEFIITQKLDGGRLVCIKRNHNDIKFFTRAGQAVEGLVEITESMKKLPNGVYDGEILLRNDNNLKSDDLYRETMKVVRKDGDKKNLEYNVFDFIGTVEDFEAGIDKIPFKERKAVLTNIIKFLKPKHIVLVKNLYEGTDKSKILELLDKVIEQGLEGIMINKADAPYLCKRNNGILKVKKFHTADVRVVDMIEGTGRNEGLLGAITIVFEDEAGERHRCDVGSGFSDAERNYYWNHKEELVGKIVEIGYFEISSNQQGGKGLRFPTWKGRVRNDKKEISMY